MGSMNHRFPIVVVDHTKYALLVVSSLVSRMKIVVSPMKNGARSGLTME